MADQVFSPEDDCTITKQFGKTAFEFGHTLSQWPIFEFGAIRRYCERADADNVSVLLDVGKRRSDSALFSTDSPLTLLEALDRLEEVDALIFLKRINVLPEWEDVLNEVGLELGELLGVSFKHDFRRPVATIIVASPGRVTPYHLDSAINCLFQIHGTKEFHTFDGNDHHIVDDQCLEKYYGERDYNAAKLTDEIRPKSTKFQLGPGRGVHVPLNFPHWAVAGPEVSVAISINWQPIFNRIGNVARVNRALRKFGLKPAPSGNNPALDWVKASALQSALTLVRTYRDRA